MNRHLGNNVLAIHLTVKGVCTLLTRQSASLTKVGITYVSKTLNIRLTNSVTIIILKLDITFKKFVTSVLEWASLFYRMEQNILWHYSPE